MRTIHVLLAIVSGLGRLREVGRGWERLGEVGRGWERLGKVRFIKFVQFMSSLQLCELQ